MRSGFTIIRNGNRLGYPYLESIRSLAPLVDEIVIAVGDSDDGTPESLTKLRQELPCELRLFDSPWDKQSLKGGFELARQTNLALDKCRGEICLYLQADEVLDDKEYGVARQDLERFAQDAGVEALAFSWIHFYGNFSHWVESKKWYRREIRAIKKSSGLRSFGDAQGFRIPDTSAQNTKWTKAKAALSRAHVLHYGWVRPPQIMAAKSEALDRLWHGSTRDGSHSPNSMYFKQFGLKKFMGQHPTVMKSRIDEMGDFDPFLGQKLNWGLKEWRMAATAIVEKMTGWRPGEFKNYRSLTVY